MGASRTGKEYLYLLETLTQSLLKLNSINAGGQDNMKAARKEAIRCVNKCIPVLEAKPGVSDNRNLKDRRSTCSLLHR